MRSSISLAVLLHALVACGGGISSAPDDAGGGPGDKVGSTGSTTTLPDGGRAPVDASAKGLDGSTPTSDASIASDASVMAVGSSTCPAGSPLALNRVRFYPAQGQGAAMVGGTFQGSNTSQTNDFVDLGKIDQPPPDGQYSELTFSNDTVYRYIKYYSPMGSSGVVAELEFYHDQTKLTGAGFGTASTVSGVTYALALDGDTTTSFQGSLADGNYIGLDIAGSAIAAAPTFSPVEGTLTSATDITITAGAGALIHYSTDGSNPSATQGTLYTAPVNIASGHVTLKAVASADCVFDSPVAQATYDIGTVNPVQTTGFKSYHIGNSLTDTINPWLEPIADSTGVDHKYARWTIPGSTVKYLWEHKGDGFGTDSSGTDIGAENFDTFVQTFAPIDHLTVQPFADPSLTFEGAAGIGMVQGVQAYSPNVQAWIYAQWPSSTDWMDDALAVGASWADPPWPVPSAPTDWVSAVQNQQLYHEKFRQFVDDAVPGKSVLVIPAGAALVELKKEIEAGSIAGITGDFFAYAFQDDLHLKPPVQYFVALVFYSCFYKQSPEGRVVVPAELGLTDDQAHAFQRIAWNIASAYPLSGITSP